MMQNELIEKLKYVDYVLSDDGYQSESEPRKNISNIIDFFSNTKSYDSSLLLCVIKQLIKGLEFIAFNTPEWRTDKEEYDCQTLAKLLIEKYKR